MTSSPRWQWLISAARFDWVPEGKNSAASKPKISAARACRRLTVGSSPKTSSPSSASSIAWRIPAEGRVTVSERRSTIAATGGSLNHALRHSGPCRFVRASACARAGRPGCDREARALRHCRARHAPGGRKELQARHRDLSGTSRHPQAARGKRPAAVRPAGQLPRARAAALARRRDARRGARCALRPVDELLAGLPRHAALRLGYRCGPERGLEALHRGRMDLRRHERRLDKRLPRRAHESRAREAGDSHLVGVRAHEQRTGPFRRELQRAWRPTALGAPRGRPVPVPPVPRREEVCREKHEPAGHRARRRAGKGRRLPGVQPPRLCRRGARCRSRDALLGPDGRRSVRRRPLKRLLQLMTGATMKKTFAALLCLWSTLGWAQTAEELLADGKNPENVTTFGMGYDLKMYSPLKQIDKSNVRRLVPAWSFSLANDMGEHSQPTIYNGVMYVVNGNWTFAIDVATGRQIWRTPGQYERAALRVATSGALMRGPATIYQGKLFRQTVDAHVLALDMKTGKEIWKQKYAEWKEGYKGVIAPIIANGVLVSGMGGGDSTTRGFVEGYDPDTGKQLWRRWTIPAPGEPGSETWPHQTKPDAWKYGGGATWQSASYDPQLDLLYIGTGNAEPYNI